MGRLRGRLLNSRRVIHVSSLSFVLSILQNMRRTRYCSVFTTCMSARPRRRFSAVAVDIARVMRRTLTRILSRSCCQLAVFILGPSKIRRASFDDKEGRDCVYEQFWLRTLHEKKLEIKVGSDPRFFSRPAWRWVGRSWEVLLCPATFLGCYLRGVVHDHE